ncbi:MAG: CARDB domain-containing protein, partial [Nanoarchaeota archaeon]
TMKFRDEAIDKDEDGKFDALRIYAEVNIDDPGNYVIETWLHDDNNVPFYKFEEPMQLQKGLNEAVIEIPSKMIYDKKLIGSLKVPYIRLFKDGKQLGSVTTEYYTNPYKYNDFSVELPDLIITSVEKKDNKLLVVVENSGKKHAFNVAVDLKVGNDFVFGQQNRNRVSLMKIGDKHEFSIDIPSAKEFIIVADPTNFVDESNETNNEMLIVK